MPGGAGKVSPTLQTTFQTSLEAAVAGLGLPKEVSGASSGSFERPRPGNAGTPPPIAPATDKIGRAARPRFLEDQSLERAHRPLDRLR